VDNKELIRQVLGELAQAQCFSSSPVCAYEGYRKDMNEKYTKIKQKIEQYAKELGVEPPDFDWSIYILPRRRKLKKE
jgi:hypothetical protein